jgi:DNA-binding LacI/PurR family transcriptional regulator
MQKRRDKRIMISDIARAVGVSPSTVSYVLSGKRSISAETKTRVIEYVEKLGYRPNAFARSLVQNRSNIIGLYTKKNIVRDDLFLISVIAGITGVLNPRGYKLLLLDEIDDTDINFTIPVDRTFPIDGAVVTDTRNMIQYLNGLKKECLPFVLLGKAPPGEKLCYVDNDNAATVYHAVERFFQMGLFRIALVTDTRRMDTFALDCLTGYTTVHGDYHRDYDPNLIIHWERGKTDPEEFKESLLGLNPDAVFLTAADSEIRDYCIYRMGAIPVVCFAFDLVMGFYPDKYSLSHLWYVDSNAFSLGAHAAEMLLGILDGLPPEGGRLLPQRLHRLCDEGG